ncbi:MAG: DUF3179 domain-containing (seleno)protein [Bryobacteraceae bacterium]
MNPLASDYRATLTRRGLLAVPALLYAAGDPELAWFFRAFNRDGAASDAALAEIGKSWRDGLAPMLIEYLRIVLHHSNSPVDPRRFVAFLEQRTGQSHGTDLHAWNRWMWSRPYQPHPKYAEFKGLLYANIDQRMREFFPPGVRSEVRLDQVEWGGVEVNGIPPLVNPKTVRASEASYLGNGNVVFGIEIGGEARAYPKRILAWHEMARDRIGGAELAIVYCTLCGAVIPWFAASGERRFTLGTSGLLYESSKLMFDDDTKSLWSTLQGRPVIGALAGSDIQLEFAPVVTTTWREWRESHPGTTVLAFDTGHDRDYSEGAAYHDYFATDRLMFEVSRHDKRLRNKAEILAIRLPGKTPLAISVSRLRKKPDLTIQHEGARIEIATTKAGASTVMVDGRRIPAHRAFWFGWYAQFPGARLVE